MKREDLLTAAELQVLLAGDEECADESELDEPLKAKDLHTLQKTVLLLSKQVEELQAQLHEQFELQNRQQEQFLRLCRHQLENKLHEQLVNTIVVHQQGANQEDKMELEHAPVASEEVKFSGEPIHDSSTEDASLPFSRVKSYTKIRKRKKGFFERLFE
ncbi:hypothetical protein [Paenibacillus oryzisoli]|uniref:Uncharacterized protein n=1 Tax=Paenibacillus oryzisoli TaxID=1850517 RepID=A0A198AHQ6_9BACL|nr:hypothetical protein [Paenibacillus oryzisoli]OAS20566.1 hypothetical protein A8708_18620 [Paenibacillus oryzisoli]